jgi:hypothetical protein
LVTEKVFLVDADRRPNSELLVVQETNNVVTRCRVTLVDGQLPIDTRVVEEWVDGRDLRSERSVLEEDRKARQAEDDQRAAEEAERRRRDDLSLGGVIRRAWDSTRKRF